MEVNMLEGTAERYVDAYPNDFCLLVIYPGATSTDAGAIADRVIDLCCERADFMLKDVAGDSFNKEYYYMVIITVKKKKDGTNYFLFENDIGDSREFEPSTPGRGIDAHMINTFFEEIEIF